MIKTFRSCAAGLVSQRLFDSLTSMLTSMLTLMLTLMVAVFSSSLWAASAPMAGFAPARVAIVAVPADDAAARLVARMFEGLLPGDVVLDDEVLRMRLRGPVKTPIDIATQLAVMVAADEEFNALNHERSIALLDGLIEQLEFDLDFSVEKAALLEQARLTSAQRLLGLDLTGEKNDSETKYSNQAKKQLVNALRVNNKLKLDSARYPPKLRSLFARAADDVQKAGQGSLLIKSKPDFTRVFLDGQLWGVTPMPLATALSVGRHRFWLESATGQRSFIRVIDVEAGVLVAAEVDVAFEGSLVAAAPGVSPMVPFQQEDWVRLAEFIDVDIIVAVGVEDGFVWGISAQKRGFPTKNLRAAKVKVGQEAALLSYLRRGCSDGIIQGGVPASVLVAPASDLVGGGDHNEVQSFPWGVVGVVAGVVGAVAIATGVTAGVVYATREVTTTIGVSVGDPP